MYKKEKQALQNLHKEASLNADGISKKETPSESQENDDYFAYSSDDESSFDEGSEEEYSDEENQFRP
ncbi:hypothetical protein [Legionella drancourtii]|uniref:Uncharacterized protein n=1 Tax=Legionella drancourtii LLAP12 TaxID=658187 RepID=G9EM99_9GAMM|nr:hypothetical protein [Legionella drancourtii]EHL31699.1 hypothetical protein LDG_6363 [Legionella drancourtii LLAP12]